MQKQHILAIIRDPVAETNAIRHGLELACIFDIPLAIAILKNSKEIPFPMTLEELEDIVHSLQGSNKVEIQTFYMDPIKAQPNLSIRQLEAIFIIMQITNHTHYLGKKLRPLLQIIYRSRIPSIIIQSQTPIANCYKKIYIPINHKRETKEKMIWASYFGRFHNSQLILLKAHENTPKLVGKIQATIIFARKLFKQFTFEYKVIAGKSNSSGIQQEAFSLANEHKDGMVVIMTHPNNSLWERLMGPRILKPLRNPHHLPVMCITPRNDGYLPCP